MPRPLNVRVISKVCDNCGSRHWQFFPDVKTRQRWITWLTTPDPASREMLESDWTSGHFRLSCHNFEPFIESKEVERLRTDMIRGWMKKLGKP